MKKNLILPLIIFLILQLSACDMFKKEVVQTPSVIETQKQDEKEEKIDIEKVNLEHKLKMEKAEKEYKEKRQKAIKDAVAHNKEETDRQEAERLSRYKSETEAVEKKRLAQSKAELDSINQVSSSEMQKIALEYTAELDRIKKDYESKLQKIGEEYDIQIAKIERDYESRPDETDKKDEELAKIEKTRLNQEYEADRYRINEEYIAAGKRATREKDAQNSASAKRMDHENRWQSKKAAVDKVLAAYEEKLQSVKITRESSKSLFVENTKIKYDKMYSALSAEDKAIDSIWEKLIAQEEKEIIEYFLVEGKKYIDFINSIDKLKTESLARL